MIAYFGVGMKANDRIRNPRIIHDRMHVKLAPIFSKKKLALGERPPMVAYFGRWPSKVKEWSPNDRMSREWDTYGRVL